MFSSDISDGEPSKLSRRAFLVSASSAAAGLVAWQLGRPRHVRATYSGTPPIVTLVQFSDDGKSQGKAELPKVIKPDDEWQQQLSANAFDIARRADTEMPYSGKYWNNHESGLYRCLCCDNALFSSQVKYDSGTGWPSFWQPIAEQNIETSTDRSLGMARTEVGCRRCDAHLGHVFNDGPQPTGLRYCMNSESLRFVKFA